MTDDEEWVTVYEWTTPDQCPECGSKHFTPLGCWRCDWSPIGDATVTR